MIPSTRQQFRLFKAFGITVSLHWTWFLVAVFQLERRGPGMPLGLAIAEYLALFAMVLMHEFGHALACRQVGGSARDIILWPLGGVAFVSPPQRPGATLWSIAAGPLVNLVLALPLTAALFLRDSLAMSPAMVRFVWDVWSINIVLFVFNVLPVYPLDGGQILRSLLWFVFGRVKSLWIASVVGVIGAVGFIGYAVLEQSLWMGVIALFILSQCWAGFKEARLLKQIEAIPRHNAFACPGCNAHPMQAPVWVCGNCQKTFDPFLHGGTCPACGHTLDSVTCPDCRQAHSLAGWGA